MKVTGKTVKALIEQVQRETETKPQTNIPNPGKQFETTIGQVGKQFHNSKLKTKILTFLGLKGDNSSERDLKLPDGYPNINHITSGCYDLPYTEDPPAGKRQAVYQSLRALREEEKVVLLGGVYYRAEDTVAISNQVKRLFNDSAKKKADAERLLKEYNTQLKYFYALHHYIKAGGSYEGFANHWSNRK
jgi:hypothetical protein